MFQQHLGVLHGDRLLDAFLHSYYASRFSPAETNGAINLLPSQIALSFENGLRFITWVRSRLDNIVGLLVALCQNSTDAEVVSEEVIVALQDGWAAAKQAVYARSATVLRPQDVDSCPALVESHDGRYFPVEDRRSIQEFEAKLAELRATVKDRQTGLDGQVSVPRIYGMVGSSADLHVTLRLFQGCGEAEYFCAGSVPCRIHSGSSTGLMHDVFYHKSSHIFCAELALAYKQLSRDRAATSVMQLG